MCEKCWDADERKKVINTPECDGHIEPFLSLRELKRRLTQKWKETKKNSFTVYKDALLKPPKGNLSWTLVETQGARVKMQVKFI